VADVIDRKIAPFSNIVARREISTVVNKSIQGPSRRPTYFTAIFNEINPWIFLDIYYI
jgi:hypothetical protein